MVLVIDADSIAYKLADKCLVYGDSGSKGFDVEEGFVGDEKQPTRFESHSDEDGNTIVVETDIDIAIEMVSEYVDRIIEAANTIHKDKKITKYVLYLTAGKKVSDLYEKKYGHDNIDPCFRYEVADDLAHGYKHSRVSKPLFGYATIMEAMALNFDSELFDVLEADDACVAICNANPDTHILAAMDKDVLNQTVGTHVNYHKLGEEDVLYTTTERYAIFYKYWQAIVGDPSDGYKGVPGIGAVGAAKFIQPEMSEVELYNNTLRAYKSKSLGYKECLATLRLADMTQCKIDSMIDDTSFKWHLELYTPPEGAEDGCKV